MKRNRARLLQRLERLERAAGRRRSGSTHGVVAMFEGPGYIDSGDDEPPAFAPAGRVSVGSREFDGYAAVVAAFSGRPVFWIPHNGR